MSTDKVHHNKKNQLAALFCHFLSHRATLKMCQFEVVGLKEERSNLSSMFLAVYPEVKIEYPKNIGQIIQKYKKVIFTPCVQTLGAKLDPANQPSASD